ncbi:MULTISPECIES: SH3 domain-containing protein [Streptomyces]|uniref:SH3 domain-containing protein n=1 Tax=Streptomyces TaxID=1883 RepID=UPI0008F4E968|nr:MULTISPECIES: SH3 domain-containing protein [Streptomyces]WAC98630.1 SH3 domain-containing protein [Streptomyces sp. NA13]
MSLRSQVIKVGTLVAAGALALAAPAGALAPTPEDAQASNQAAVAAPKVYKGRVIAKTGLILRDAPTRGGAVVGTVPYGKVVDIRCKVESRDVVDGNPRWYLLTNGRWAWGSARYIENIGEAPRWC